MGSGGFGDLNQGILRTSQHIEKIFGKLRKKFKSVLSFPRENLLKDELQPFFGPLGKYKLVFSLTSWREIVFGSEREGGGRLDGRENWVRITQRGASTEVTRLVLTLARIKKCNVCLGWATRNTFYCQALVPNPLCPATTQSYPAQRPNQFRGDWGWH